MKKYNFLLSALLVPAIVLQVGATCTGSGGGPSSVTLPASVTGIQTYNYSASTLYQFLVKTVSSAGAFVAGTTYSAWCTNHFGTVPGGGTNSDGTVTPPTSEDPNNPTGVATYTPVNSYSISSTITQDYGQAGLTYDATLNGGTGGFTTTSLLLSQEWAAVNWILNNPKGVSGENPSTTDTQNAIWQLLHPNDGIGYVVLNPPVAGALLTGNSWLLYKDALANGLNFTPTTGQVVGILMVPTTPAGSPMYQGFVIPVPIACTASGTATMTKTSNVSSAGAFQLVTYTYTIKNTGSTTLQNIVVVDDNGTPNYTADDVTITPAAGTTLAPGATMTLTSSVYLPLSLFYQSGNEAAYDTLIPQVIPVPSGSPLGTLPTASLTYLIDTDVTNNTYGKNASAGWAGNGGHTFAQVMQGYAEFSFTNSKGTTVSDFTVGYLQKTASGYAASVISTSVPNSYGPTVDSTEADNLALYPTATTDSMQTQGNWQTIAGYKVLINEGVFGMYGFGGISVKKNYLAATETGFSGKCGSVRSATYTPSFVCSTVNSTAWMTANVCGCSTIVKAKACLSVKLSNCASQPTCNNPGGHQCQNSGHCGCTCSNCLNGCHGNCTAWVKCTPPQCSCNCANCKAGNHQTCTHVGCTDSICHANNCSHNTIQCKVTGKPATWLCW